MNVERYACSRLRKKRKIPLIRGAGLILLCFFLTKFFLKYNKKESTTQQALIIPEIEWSETENNLLVSKLKEEIKKENIIPHTVKKGENFYTIFSNYNINKTENNLLFRILSQLELSSLFPGDSILIKKGDSSSFSSITLFSRLQKKYIIENSDSIFYGRAEVPEFSLLTYLVNGTLETSLSEALYEQGVSDVVTANIADIFAWDIDFFTDPRKGDTFQIIFEKKIINGKVVSDGNVLAAKYTLINNNKCFYAFCLPDEKGRLHYYDENGKALQKEFLKAPLRYSRVSSSYTYRRKHPILGIVRPHLGIDYAAPSGTPVYAAADGKISFAGVKGDYGNLIIISHGSLYQTYYGHLSSFAPGIYVGKFVKQGEFIGRVGATGLATGPHLDYRMVKNGAFINPNNLKCQSVSSVPEERIKEFLQIKETYLTIFNNRFRDKEGCYVIDTEVNSAVHLKSVTMNKNSLVTTQKKVEVN
ncbi:MAG: M23 family metallopeptidase [Chitinispirillaceae bacterium]|nr:M23 family metallopeptidase [Chitinispirillaceae bacterium]